MGKELIVLHILDELNHENGKNYKIGVLKKHADNALFKRMLCLTFDRVKYTFGLSVKHWHGDSSIFQGTGTATLSQAFDLLEFKLSSRELTGNAAIDAMDQMFRSLSPDDAQVAYRVLNRDLKINIGRTSINKVFDGLISKQLYMRCGVYSKKTASKIDFKNGAIVQLKADGTYREFTVDNGTVAAHSRSGEEYEYPVHFDLLKSYPDGHYFGELTVRNPDGSVMVRSEGNGLINSDDPPHNQIIFDCWDYVTLEEYTMAANKQDCKIPYKQRLAKLAQTILEKNNKIPLAEQQIRLIEGYEVENIREALERCSNWMNEGFEGAILKDLNSVFRDGTNPGQLKLKLEIDADVRILGFVEGRPGTVREKTFGAIEFGTDDGQIKGRTSGFTDAQLADFNSRRSEMIGKIITVQFNDLSKARGNDYYALSHPRFIELRNDKTETDTLERILELRQMAMELSE